MRKLTLLITGLALATAGLFVAPQPASGEATGDLVAAVALDPGDQSWFLCVAHRPYGVGQIYNDFMVTPTIAQCFVDYSYNPGLPSCPNLYDFQVWYTPQYGGWTGPHDIDGPYC